MKNFEQYKLEKQAEAFWRFNYNQNREYLEASGIPEYPEVVYEEFPGYAKFIGWIEDLEESKKADKKKSKEELQNEINPNRFTSMNLIKEIIDKIRVEN